MYIEKDENGFENLNYSEGTYGAGDYGEEKDLDVDVDVSIVTVFLFAAFVISFLGVILFLL